MTKNKIVGITFGSFDLCHYGHALMFEECKEYCDYLIVGVQSDPSIGSRILSKDLRFGAFLLTLSDVANNHQDRSAVLEKIKKLTLNTSPTWTYSGVSVLRTEYVGYMLRDNFVFLPPIAIILISLLGYVFRNWVFVALPLLTVLTTVTWLLGIMGLFNLEIKFSNSISIFFSFLYFFLYLSSPTMLFPI